MDLPVRLRLKSGLRTATREVPTSDGRELRCMERVNPETLFEDSIQLVAIPVFDSIINDVGHY